MSNQQRVAGCDHKPDHVASPGASCARAPATGTSPAIVDDVDLLRRWWREDVGYANYEIEPGCEYRESFATAVRADELLELEVTFHWQGYIWPPVYDLRRRQLRWREQDRLVEYAIFRTGPADAQHPPKTAPPLPPPPPAPELEEEA